MIMIAPKKNHCQKILIEMSALNSLAREEKKVGDQRMGSQKGTLDFPK